ncbi:hypothetical protein CN230_31335 [Sinorhizobium meliloti]|uniref:hypothetical protein n=1 Tax=Rhizobium meliloti TaxID=382 RepID=UPI000FD9A295|nr:hypothetical protein [Sinorhizobium meliloti]RVG01815.1 hypothetical protein CN230_31335 [Sinorhizobium meliloti]
MDALFVYIFLNFGDLTGTPGGALGIIRPYLIPLQQLSATSWRFGWKKPMPLVSAMGKIGTGRILLRSLKSELRARTYTTSAWLFGMSAFGRWENPV